MPSGVYSPDGTPKAVINSVGGMSYKINQLVQNGNFSDSTGWNGTQGTISVSDNVLTYTQTIVSNSNRIIGNVLGTIQNHKYLVVANINYLDNLPNASNIFIGSGGYDGYNGAYTTFTNTNTWYKCVGIFTRNTGGDDTFNIYPRLANVNDRVSIKTSMCIDLTDMGIDTTDVATATSELLKRGIDINTYNAYDTGSIRDSAITSITSKDSNNTTLETKTINASIQALTGYGWGINDTCYNYIDYENKKFIQKVGRVDLGTLTWSYSSNRFSASCPSDLKPVANGVQPNWVCVSREPKPNNVNLNDNQNAICYIVNNQTFITYASSSSAEKPSGYLYYELATPVETNISAYLDYDSIVVDANGTLTFDNTYNQAVPSSIDYLTKEVKA